MKPSEIEIGRKYETNGGVVVKVHGFKRMLGLTFVQYEYTNESRCCCTLSKFCADFDPINNVIENIKKEHNI